jgi:uncharacterized membrane protein
MAEKSLLIGLSIGILSYCCLYLGKGIQKLGIEKIKARGSIKKKESGVWIAGTILTIIPVFLQWTALAFAPVNVIAPLEGLGLIVLVVFSFFALKEKVSSIESAGIFLIVAGTFLTAYFAAPIKELSLSSFKPLYFVWIFSGLVIIELILFLISRKAGFGFAGVILGFTAGTMMAFQSISKRISVIPGLFIWGMVLTFVFAILTLVITQIGFARARASQVVPSFTSASIVVASAASIFILGESIEALQYLGIGIIILGVILLTVFGSRETGKISIKNGTSSQTGGGNNVK